MAPTKQQSAARIYKESTVSTYGKYYNVRLDGQPIYTPAGNRLNLPNHSIAKAIAAEWQNQKTTIDPASMSFMKLASTAIDRVAPHRETVIKNIIAYGGTDLLCYRAENPAELVEAQAKAWQPILDWLAQESGAYLKVTSGVVHLEQGQETLDALDRMVRSFEDFSLTVVYQFTQMFTSLSLALAVAKGRIDWSEGTDLAFLDETFQAKRWGEDHEAIIRVNNMRKEIEQMARFLEFCR